MINIAILTSEDNELTEKIIQYYNNYQDTQISCVISNDINSTIDKRIRRYKVKTQKTPYYKEIDKILTETNTQYIICAHYNEQLPPNFCKKYNWKLINLDSTDNEIIIHYVNNNNDIIFRKDFENKFFTVDEMAQRFYPIVIEKVIRETHNKIQNI